MARRPNRVFPRWCGGPGSGVAQGTRPPHGGQVMKRRGLLIVVGLIVALSALSYSVYLWRRDPPETAPPAIDLSGADPVVAQAIEQARTEVLQQPRSAVAWGRLGMVLAGH